MLINLLRHAKFIASAACVISIIIHVSAVSCTPKQIDLQAFLLYKAEADVNRQLHYTNTIISLHLHKVFLTKQI